MKPTYIITGLVLALASCNKICKDEPLAFQRIENNTNQLKLNGYYCFLNRGENIYTLYVFYNNGVALDPPGSDKPEGMFNDPEFLKQTKEIKRDWGLYTISSSDIKITSWRPAQCSMPTYLKSGQILNDTTFVLKESKLAKDGSGYTVLNDTFRFKQFSPKPDSVNSFVQ